MNRLYLRAAQDIHLKILRKVCRKEQCVRVGECVLYIIVPLEPLDQEPDLKTIYNDLIQSSCDWEDIAINLNLDQEISRIDKDGRNVGDKLRKLLLKWKQGLGLPYTWRTIIEALEEPTLGENKAASQMRDRLTKS